MNAQEIRLTVEAVVPFNEIGHKSIGETNLSG